MTRNDQYQYWAHMHGPTDPCSCAISFHLQGKNLPGGFNLILSHYILDAWGKTWVLTQIYWQAMELPAQNRHAFYDNCHIQCICYISYIYENWNTEFSMHIFGVHTAHAVTVASIITYITCAIYTTFLPLTIQTCATCQCTMQPFLQPLCCQSIVSLIQILQHTLPILLE